jgi:hypothetical protein
MCSKIMTYAATLALSAALGSGTALAQLNGTVRSAAGLAPAVIVHPAIDTNEGHFVCTAAITANGTIFSSHYANATLTGRVLPAQGGLAAGTYQVSFNTTGSPCPVANIAAGWFRHCQVDTLTIGTVAGYCTTADRAAPGPTGAIWVETFNIAGTPTNLPFILSVSR